MKILCALLVCILLSSPFSFLSVSADETPTTVAETHIIDTVPEQNVDHLQPASDITERVRVTSRGFDRSWPMTDGAFRYYCEGRAGATVTLSGDVAIGGVYVLFDEVCESWSVSDGTEMRIEKKEEFIHQYVDTASVFGEDCRSLTLTFDVGARVSEIYVLGLGACPDWVQRWESTPERTDILLISAHSDDEQLFFAGILPYYTSEGRIVTVAYLTEHYDKHERRHERLNGLWHAGVRYYPIVCGITDRYSTDMEWAKRNLADDGHTLDEVDGLIVELFRMTRPLVVFTHDFEGEYKHGQHILLADSVARMLKVSSDKTIYPESADRYGTYEVPKAYFHLWGENKIRFSWDEPSDKLGGKSPFEVSREAFLCHTSQLSSKFYKWIFGEEGAWINSAADIAEHSPLEFGLYHSTVGYGTSGDIFEGLIPYSDVGRVDELPVDTETVPPETETVSPDTECLTLDAETAVDIIEKIPEQTISSDSDTRPDTDTPNMSLIFLVVFVCVALGAYVLICRRKK